MATYHASPAGLASGGEYMMTPQQQSPNLKSTSVTHSAADTEYSKERQTHVRPTAHGYPKRIYALWAWKWEFLALLAGLGIFVAMLVILARYNDKPVEEWTFVLNLNSFIALLSTIYRAIMVSIAGEIISQTKWTYFWSASVGVPLLNLQYFNSGSHSMWGAIRLLPITIRRSFPAFITSLIIIVSFAVGPFIQQSLNTAQREFVVQSGTASLPIARALDGNGSYFRTLAGSVYGMWDFKYDIRARTLSALSNPGSNDSAIVPVCSSGNCTFPSCETGRQLHTDREMTHSTVGMCSRCFDVTSLATLRDKKDNSTFGSPVWDLPNGMNVTAFDSRNWLNVGTTPNLTWTGDLIPQDALDVIRWAFANVTVFTLAAENASSYQPSIPVAVTCSLYPCLRSYSASVTNGRLTENLLRTEPMYPDVGNFSGDVMSPSVSENNQNAVSHSPWPVSGAVPGSPDHIAAVQSPCLIDGIVYTTDNFSSYSNTTTTRILSPAAQAAGYPSAKVPPQCLYTFDSFFVYMFGGFFRTNVFSGVCRWDRRQGASIYCGEKYWLAQFWELTFASSDTVVGRFDRFAEAATRQFRLGMGLASPYALANEVEGEALRSRAYVTVDFKWLIFPIALFALEIFVLIWVVGRSVWKANEEMVWKNNLLPVLYYKDRFVDRIGSALGGAGAASSAQVEGERLMSTAEMERDASGVNVRLLKGGGKGDYTNVGLEGVRERRPRDWDQDSLMGE